MNSEGANTDILFRKVKELIVCLRKGENVDVNWRNLQALIENNIQEVCSSFNTRWLVSIADTYADFGNDIEKRNALYISIIPNMEKLFATRLLIYDLTRNEERLEILKGNSEVALWDGMTSFNIVNGNMTNNLFRRIREMLEQTKVLELIFETVIERLPKGNTVLTDLDLYHKRVFESHQKDPGFLKRSYTWLRRGIKQLFS